MAGVGVVEPEQRCGIAVVDGQPESLVAGSAEVGPGVVELFQFGPQSPWPGLAGQQGDPQSGSCWS